MKIQIHSPVLLGHAQDQVLQRVASAYEGESEYRIYAPARAKGDALEWVEHFTVRQPSENGQGENEVNVQTYRIVVQEVKEQLEKHKLDSDIWTWDNDKARFYSGQICQKGHVHSSDGKNPASKGDHCQQCGSAIIVSCSHCNAPIRGQDVYLTAKYVRPSFCYKCGRAYPWQEDRLNTDREKLWGLLKDVMSNPTDDLVPAKRKLIDINLARAGQMTKDILTDLVAKTMAEIVKG